MSSNYILMDFYHKEESFAYGSMKHLDIFDVSKKELSFKFYYN